MNQEMIDAAAIEEWISQDLTVKSLESTLILRGYEKRLVKEYLFEFKRLKRAKSQMFGFMIVSLTVLIGVFACFIVLHK